MMIVFEGVEKVPEGTKPFYVRVQGSFAGRFMIRYFMDKDSDVEVATQGPFGWGWGSLAAMEKITGFRPKFIND